MAKPFIFNVEPVARFAALDAGIRRPREIAHFSYDDKHEYHLNDSSLRYYFPPTLPADLSEGFDTFQQLDDTGDDHLDGLLDAIVAHEMAKGAKIETDIMTWRGMMTKIMCTPYSKLDSWEMNLTCFQGTVFIEENHTKKLASRAYQYKGRPQTSQPSQDIMSYWGYKFETLSLIPEPWSPTSREYIESRDRQIVNNHAQYCSIVRTGFGKVNMVLGGEVDAVWDTKPDDPSQPINWVELKTSAEITNEREQVKFERKLIKFWAQSFLLGVPRIVVGFRDQQGILRRLQQLDTQRIPEIVQSSGRNLWHGQTCINFAASFLEWVKTVVTEEGVWRLRKLEKASTLELFKLEETGHGSILSDAFLQWRNTGLPDLAALDLGKSAEVVADPAPPPV